MKSTRGTSAADDPWRLGNGLSAPSISIRCHQNSTSVRLSPHALFLISRDQYVGARLSLVGGAVFAAQLAMHQCVETASKAMLKSLTPGRRFGGNSGHKLLEFLNELAPKCPGVDAVLNDPDAAKVVSVLDQGYTQIRYGEGVLGMEMKSTLRAFDMIAWHLFAEAGKLLKYGSEISLSVAERVLEIFLLDLSSQVVVERSTLMKGYPWVSAEVVIKTPPR